MICVTDKAQTTNQGDLARGEVSLAPLGDG
jgi:hypothetical protein